MLLSRVLVRVSRGVGRGALLLSEPQKHQFPIISNQFHSLSESPNKLVASQVSLLLQSANNSSSFQRFGFFSSASPEPSEKNAAQSGNENGPAGENDCATKTSGEAIKEDLDSRKTEESDSESDGDLSIGDLVKLVAEKEELLKVKHKEMEKMQDKILRNYAEMENVMDRTRREADNSKKFAIQSFAKGLLDVADNLGRASSVVNDSFSKIDVSKDTIGAVQLLKTLLEGVEMTEKQLADVFRKFGVEKFDPINDQFDPNRHNAVYQMPDASKSPGTVATVLKCGYTLHERVIRPAEVCVTQAVEDRAAENNVGDKHTEA